MTMPSPSRGVARPLGIWPGGPPATFAGCVLAAFATLAVCWLTLPRDFALPFVATLLFALAAVVAFAGWSQRPAGRQDAVTYLDVAGALTLIGIFAASLVDPDQMVRIVAGTYREE